LVKAVLLGTANCDVDTGSESTAAPRYAHEGPGTVVPTGEVEEWDVINLTEDGESVEGYSDCWGLLGLWRCFFQTQLWQCTAQPGRCHGVLVLVM
jgi:hypothetical protein